MVVNCAFPVMNEAGAGVHYGIFTFFFFFTYQVAVRISNDSKLRISLLPVDSLLQLLQQPEVILLDFLQKVLDEQMPLEVSELCDIDHPPGHRRHTRGLAQKLTIIEQGRPETTISGQPLDRSPLQLGLIVDPLFRAPRTTAPET